MVRHWPWLAAYIATFAALFLFSRRSGSTDGEAAALRSGYRPQRPGEFSLQGAARIFFSFPSPPILVAIILLASIGRLVGGAWTWLDAVVVVAMIVYWPIQEWLVHVCVLHLKPVRVFGVQVDPILARNHRNHHCFPSVPELFITPLYIVWFYLGTVPVLLAIALPWPHALTGMVLFFSLVLNYEWVHYLIHSTYQPRSMFYKRLWRNHRLHHFKDEHFWFGVTMLLGDRMFGTQPSLHAMPPSDTGQPREDGYTELPEDGLRLAHSDGDSPNLPRGRGRAGADESDHVERPQWLRSKYRRKRASEAAG